MFDVLLNQFGQLTISGIALGFIYVLISLGYTMVYGVLRMINFAHSEVFMSGPFTTAFAADALIAVGWWNTHPLLSLLIVMLVSAGVSASIALMLERIAYRPLRGAPRLVPLITAIGVSILLQTLAMIIFKPNYKPYPALLPVEPIEWAGAAGARTGRSSNRSSIESVDASYRNHRECPRTAQDPRC